MIRLWEQFIHALTGRVATHATLPDLRGLPSHRVAIERTHYLANDNERHDQAERLYVLRRDAADHRSTTSIAVYANGRSVGYLPDRVSRGIAAHLDQLGGAAIVSGAGVGHGSIRLRVYVPTRDALHDFTLAQLREDAADPIDGARPRA